MNHDQGNIQQLWELYVSDKATPEQVRLLFDYISDTAQDKENHRLFEQALVLHPSTLSADTESKSIIFQNIKDSDPVLKQLIEKADGKTEVVTPVIRSVHRVHFLRRWGWVAASILLLLLAGAYLWTTNTNEKPLVHHTQPVPSKIDVPPGKNKAVLTLSDGRTINLDDAATGQLAEDGGVNVVKSADGRIMYKTQGTTGVPNIVFNTMSTPRGGQYELTLPDGSKVWLNAASSITYPTVFTGAERNVRITGEAYFEIAKNPKMPFIVSINEQTKVRVLGTHFNVNAYPEEGKIKTSLLEGIVQINNNILRPRQAWLNGKVVETNVEQDVAWKKRHLQF